MSLIFTLTFIFNAVILISLIVGLLYVVTKLDEDNTHLRQQIRAIRREKKDELMSLEDLMKQFP